MLQLHGPEPGSVEAGEEERLRSFLNGIAVAILLGFAVGMLLIGLEFLLVLLFTVLLVPLLWWKVWLAVVLYRTMKDRMGPPSRPV